MAQKRMFSLSVVDTDKFLEMPISSRLLYYELGMRADDDGFVSDWKKIMKFAGLSIDDLNVLIARNYVIPFESGVIVIRHWRMNNYLQKDRTKPTIYQGELSQLTTDENNVYNLYTECIHSIDKNSIDKNSIDKNSIDKRSIEENNKQTNNWIEIFNQNIHLITPLEMEKINSYADDGIEDEAICYAIEKATLANKRTASYVLAILKNWNAKGIKSLRDAQNEEEMFKEEHNSKTQREKEIEAFLKEE